MKYIGENTMKKLLIASISVFILTNIALAQSVQQKVDSLKKEQAKAEQAKNLADAKLRKEQTGKNYQDAVAAREKMEKVSEELKAALDVLKAEEEAKARAKAEAAAKAKAAEEERLEALYKENCPQFYYAEVEGKAKAYIIEQLRKDPNWTVENVTVKFYNVRGEYDYYQLCTAFIKSATETKQFDYGTFCPDPIYQVSDWYDNPEEFYLFLERGKEKETFSNMQKAVVDYYKEYTYKSYDIKNAIVERKCKSVSFYYIDVPKQNNNDFVFNKNEKSPFMEKLNEANYIYAVCGSDRKGNIIIRPKHSYFDKIYAEKHPRKTIKTFKIEDYK